MLSTLFDEDLNLVNNVADLTVPISGCAPSYYGRACIFCDESIFIIYKLFLFLVYFCRNTIVLIDITCNGQGYCTENDTCACYGNFCGRSCNITSSYLAANANAGSGNVLVTNNSIFSIGEMVVIGESTDCNQLASQLDEVYTISGISLEGKIGILQTLLKISNLLKFLFFSQLGNSRRSTNEATTISMQFTSDLKTAHAAGELVVSSTSSSNNELQVRIIISSYFLLSLDSLLFS